MRSLLAALAIVAFGAAPALAAGEAAPSSAALEAAKRDLLASLPPAAAPPPPSPEAARRAEISFARAVPADVEVEVVGPNGSPVSGVQVRAIHDALDLMAAPATSDARGIARFRLPPGPWFVLASGPTKTPGCVVFAPAAIEVAPGARRVRLDASASARLRFRTTSGTDRLPAAVKLATPGLGWLLAVEPRERLEVRTTRATAPAGGVFVVQAVRPADASRDGFVIRRTVAGAGAVEVLTDPADSTVWRFDGSREFTLAARLTSADALWYDVTTDAAARRSVHLAGVTRTALALSVRTPVGSYAFLPRPFPLDGARTFTGRPPFDVTVGHRFNTSRWYGARQGSLSVRCFVRDRNGLILLGGAGNPFAVTWALERAGATCAQGTFGESFTAIVPAASIPREGAFLYRLRAKGPGLDRSVETPGHGQTERVSVGSVDVDAYPELAPNAASFAAWLDRVVRAYRDTNARGPARVRVTLWTHMAQGIYGLGSFGRCWLAEERALRITGVHHWDSNVVHETAHAFGYFHGASMSAAMARMSSRYAEIKPGPERMPAGTRWRKALEALAAGAAQAPAADDPPPGGAAPAGQEGEQGEGDDGTGAGEDGEPPPPEPVAGIDAAAVDLGFVGWYFLATYGRERDAAAGALREPARWRLTTAGFGVDDAEGAILTRAAGEPLGWLVRARGGAAHDGRVEAATAILAAEMDRLPDRAARDRIRKHWRGFDPSTEGTDLAGTAAALRAELGDPDLRTAKLLEIARAMLARGDAGGAKALLVAVLAEVRGAGARRFEDALGRAASVWAAVP